MEVESARFLGMHKPREASEAGALAAAEVGSVLAGNWPLESLIREAPKSIKECLSSLHVRSDRSPLGSKHHADLWMAEQFV